MIKNHKCLFLVFVVFLIWSLTGHAWPELSGVLFFGGIDVDGIDDLFSVPDNASLDITQAITLDAWVKTTNSSGTKFVIMKGVGRYNLATSGTKARMLIFDGSTNHSVLSTSDINDGKWHRITGTYDRVNVKIYVDGVFENQTPATTGISTGNFPLGIGALFNGSNSFPGQIGEAVIWNTALSADEILLGFKAKTKYMPLQIRLGNLAAYWPMDNGLNGTSADGDTARDLSGNGNDGIGNDGGNNTGLIWKAEEVLSYPPDDTPEFFIPSAISIPLLQKNNLGNSLYNGTILL